MTELDPISVQLGARSYPIYVGQGNLATVGERLRATQVGPRTAIVTNQTVARLYGRQTARALGSVGFDVATIEVPDGEEHKNLAWVAFLYEKMIEARLERSSAVVALGGGVVGDLTGFAAATFLRGIVYVQVPTTLLAQVDSSIGGKTGVNLAAGKNLIGAFHHPRLVIADIELLRSLPRREFLAGLAEVIKYAIILSPELFSYLEENLGKMIQQDGETIGHVVHACAQLKALVVAEDERESDYRAILNFGHTIGHAIETLTEYGEFLHGEAVAIGMAFAVRLSMARGMLDGAVGERVIKLIHRAGLPIEIPRDLRPSALAIAVEADKKRNDGRVKFVCLEGIGNTRFALLSTEELNQALETV
jgi:3-dehydroquinate synthase